MFVSHKHQIIYVAVPKTGSTSLHYALMSHLDVVCRMKNAAPVLHHLSAEDIERIMGPSSFGTYFSFGVVRNPFDRMVSLYHDFRDQRGKIRAASFDDFVLGEFHRHWRDNVHFLPQAYFLCRKDVPMVSQVYRFENGLDTILADICQRAGCSFSGIGRARASVRDHWKTYLHNPEVVDLLVQDFAVDFDLFGYDRTIAAG